MTRIILASHNRHKAVEFARLLPGFEVEPYPGDLPDETGWSFAQNAALKARHVRAAIPAEAVWVLADDSGIEARALAGRPGVRSARFAGEHATDAENLELLLHELRGVEDRAVRYVAELVALGPGGRVARGRGELTGTLTDAPRGNGGFGYDPAFVPDGETRTVAEMDAAEKDSISHRARAATALLRQLRTA